jgi:hypothetical protein
MRLLALEQRRLGADAEQDVEAVHELDVERMRPVPAAPAHVSPASMLS